MDTYTRLELAAQLDDPECDHVGAYFKSGDNEVQILALLADHGLGVDENGWAQRVAPDDTEALDTEVIDWLSYASDGYRFTADAATARTAAEPRWVLAEYEIDGQGEYVYTALTEPMTLWEAENYEQSELAELIAEAESTDDFLERERLIDELGPLIRAQIARA